MNALRLAISSAMAASLPLAAQAQQQDSDRMMQEIIVTAQKREASVQDVPFSVAAMTEDQIRESGATNIVELARNVPGLAITDLGPGQSQVAIRGISAGQVVRDQPGVKEQVGIYLDESPISVALFTPDLDLYDLQRIEVLRGPQGTLFGAGSLAGTLRYITNQPRLGELNGSAELSLNDGTGADFGGALKGAVNVPLGEQAALRVVGYYNELAGFIDATLPDGSVDKDVDGGDKKGGRIALLWQPTEYLSITPRFVLQKLDTDGFPRIDIWNILGNPFTTTEPPVTLGERGQFRQLEEGLEDDFKLGDLRIEYDLGALMLTSITSYTDREVIVTRDATQLTGSITAQPGAITEEGLPTSVARLNAPLIDTTDLQAFSQEIRLSSTDNERFQWLIGVFWQDVDREYHQRLPVTGFTAATGIPTAGFRAPTDVLFYSDITYDFQQTAIFGEGTYRFNDKWSLTAGLRWYDFEEDRVLFFDGLFTGPTPDGLPGSTSSDGFSPRVILTYSMTEDVHLSLQASRGFRLGGINDPLNIPLCTPEDIETFGNTATWDDETVWNYELGLKSTLADGRVIFNAAAFYSDIEDLQATTDAGTCSSRIVFNVPKARSIGAEMELFARPNESWDFGISATWVDAELRSSVTSPDPSGVTRAIDGLEKGNRLPTSPRFQAAASVTYSWPWFNANQGYVNLTLQHVGSSFTQFQDQSPGFGVIEGFDYFGAPTITSLTFDPELPDYQIGNLRLGVRADQWEAAAFVNNIWDERAFLSLDRERGKLARVGYLTNPPRTYGISLRYMF